MPAKSRTYAKEVGARLATARKTRGLTQQEIANALGISQQTVAHYEGGRLSVGIDLLPRLAKLLGLSFNEILLGRSVEPLPGRRRRPSRLKLQLDAVDRLPRAEQHAISTLLSAMLAQHGVTIGVAQSLADPTQRAGHGSPHDSE